MPGDRCRFRSTYSQQRRNSTAPVAGRRTAGILPAIFVSIGGAFICHSEAGFWPRNLSSIPAMPRSETREIPRCARDDRRTLTRTSVGRRTPRMFAGHGMVRLRSPQVPCPYGITPNGGDAATIGNPTQPGLDSHLQIHDAAVVAVGHAAAALGL